MFKDELEFLVKLELLALKLGCSFPLSGEAEALDWLDVLVIGIWLSAGLDWLDVLDLDAWLSPGDPWLPDV